MKLFILFVSYGSIIQSVSTAYRHQDYLFKYYSFGNIHFDSKRALI